MGIFEKQKKLNMEYIQRMNPGKNAQTLLKKYYFKKYQTLGLTGIVILLLVIALMISDLSKSKISEDGEILRGTYSESDKVVLSIVESENYKQQEVAIPVSHQKYTKKQLEELFENAKKWIAEEMKGENSSLKEVRKNLYFPSKYPDGQIYFSYMSSNYELVDAEGGIHNEDLLEPKELDVIITLFYEDIEEKITSEIILYPQELSKEEQFVKELNAAIKNEDEKQQTESSFMLPKQINGEEIIYKEKKEKRAYYALGIGVISMILLYFGMDNDLKKKYETRKEQLLFDYPEFVSKLALLIGAGMSLNGAIRRIHGDDKKKNSPLYEELNIFVHNLDNGVLEEHAIEDFGKRTGLSEYRKFCALLSVNMKKGSINLKAMLEKESEQAFEEHQTHIRKRGEKAGTKLLIPMVMMLAVVIAIIMVPAFLTYQM